MPEGRINGDRLRRLRLARKLKQGDLGKLAGISGAQISRIEHREEASTSFSTATSLARALGVPLSDLMVGQSATLVPAEMVEVPVLGVVPGGAPVLVEEMRTGEIIYVPAEAVRGVRRPYALKVQGESMFPRIGDTDFVIVDPDAFWEHRDVIVAMVGNETTVKRLAVVDGMRRLVADNQEHGWVDPRGQEVKIIGKVVWVQPQGWKP